MRALLLIYLFSVLRQALGQRTAATYFEFQWSEPVVSLLVVFNLLPSQPRWPWDALEKGPFPEQRKLFPQALLDLVEHAITPTLTFFSVYLPWKLFL